MEKEIVAKYLKAGRIAAQALQYGRGLVKEGSRLVDIAEAVERKIEQLGAKPAFPVNISINEIAAHYSPTLRNETVVKAEDYVKLDIGVHIDGWIGDIAVTARPAGSDSLIECAEKMLDRMLPLFRPGMPLAEIGAVAEQTANEFGLSPIRNLTGHALDRYNLHAGVVVPNIRTTSTKALVDGEVYAVEPFCTAGSGWVKEAQPAVIFRWLADKPQRMAEARQLLGTAKSEWASLPFARRWAEKRWPWLPVKLERALRELVNTGCLHAYPILKEGALGAVAQAEHTVIVAQQPIVTTHI